MNRRNFVRALWIAAMLLVLVTALMPVPILRELPSHTDKLVHLLCYFVLGLLAVLSQRGPGARIAAAAAMAAFGIVVELLQGLLPWRSFEWMDIVANVCGVALGGVTAAIAQRRSRTGRQDST
jgi:VanZ family protein